MMQKKITIINPRWLHLSKRSAYALRARYANSYSATGKARGKRQEAKVDMH
ncbi:MULTISPECIES: hypothetical protein [unclassified Moorena]|uniref:hypothetical protein n=1 Tax=unclassified Moorena TaxID=2683338 RepID=UPI0013FF275A|nr:MULTISPECIES: hypothetical protein [unclassified Moorena]NEO12536.1 hypothetical protein [Moorena sp. SIO3E8]NEO47851.1 hypothetical protein [Moorena sp. SIO4A3]NEQ01330.1 hypothetical protein [Moorena sp. SIO3F7]